MYDLGYDRDHHRILVHLHPQVKDLLRSAVDWFKAEALETGRRPGSFRPMGEQTAFGYQRALKMFSESGPRDWPTIVCPLLPRLATKAPNALGPMVNRLRSLSVLFRLLTQFEDMITGVELPLVSIARITLGQGPRFRGGEIHGHISPQFLAYRSAVNWAEVSVAMQSAARYMDPMYFDDERRSVAAHCVQNRLEFSADVSIMVGRTDYLHVDEPRRCPFEATRIDSLINQYVFLVGIARMAGQLNHREVYRAA